MKVEKLLRYGIPESVIESWRKTQGEMLLPLQAVAVTKHNLMNNQSLIISAPTSSGKTFCGEMAAVANLFKRKKVVFLVPLKAIAEEKYSDFCQKYAPLGCELLLEKSRPVELLQGVLLEGRFHFRKYNSGEEGACQLVESDSEESHQILFANMEKLLEDGEQILVFLKSKRNCEDCALLFSEKSNLPSSLSAIQALSELENTTLKERLTFCLQRGVAFHNADLTSGERKVIEHFYLKGEIRVIFSTTTLSLGINLPAKTVFIETQKFEKGEYSNKAVMLPISWSEYENMSGRAGRFGLQKDFGRSIIIAQNRFQFDSLWEGYIEGEEEKISSQLYKKESGDVILDLVASGAGKSLSHLKQAINSCLDGKLIAQDENVLEEKLEELVEEKILLKNGETFSPSRLGSLCAFKGISIHTGLCIKKTLEVPPDLDPFTWFYSVLNTKDGEDVYISVGFWEEQNRVYEKALTERYKDAPPPEEEIKNLLDGKISLSPRETKLVKLCSLLCDWITPESTLNLEGKYFCRSGQIEQIGKRVGWLLDAACGIARVLNSDKRLVHFLRRLSLEVNFGVDDVGVKLARLRVPGLGRDYIWSLVRENFCSLRKIKEAKLEELERTLPHQVAQRLKERIEERSKIKKTKESLVHKIGIPTEEEISLVIDGTPVKDKFLVLVNGRGANLTAKSFKYLVKLAWAAFKNEEGWIHRNDFEPGENQTRYLHRLKKQIKPNLDPGQSFLENNRLGCYRLSVSKDKIRINPPVLLKNPDIEIKKMAEELASWINVYEKHEASSLG